MAGNTFGEIFRVTTFGESHGAAVGAVIDGVPAGLEITEAEIQLQLNRRRPGQSRLTTQRSESDAVEILSGTFNGATTGTPLALLIRNRDQHSKDYSALAHLFRPAHADFGYHAKFGLRDYRGGGRSSGRETAARVAAGAVAGKLLSLYNIKSTAYVTRAANVQAKTYDLTHIEDNPLRSCDPAAALEMQSAILGNAQKGDSSGGIVECRISGMIAGLGDPVFRKLDALLAQAMLSLGAVRGIEFGNGFAAADLTGSQNNPIDNASGILGGISTGNDIVFRIAVKPTPSISLEQTMKTVDGNEEQAAIQGRHDPCILPRIVPVVEAMANIVIADALLSHRCDKL